MLSQRVVQVGDEVLGALEPHGHANDGVAQTNGRPALRAHRAVSGGGRIRS